METTAIAEQYRIYYTNRSLYYHNFEHALFTVKLGLDILNSLDVDSSLKEVFVHAMACHDAGHLNGWQTTDKENIKIALNIFDTHNKHSTKLIKSWSRLIIEATEFPHKKINKIIPPHLITNSNLKLLIQVARDSDTLGIIGIKDTKSREKALRGFMKEASLLQEEKKFNSNFKVQSSCFLKEIKFQTKYAQKWADKNLEKMKRWQMNFIDKAIKKQY